MGSVVINVQKYREIQQDKNVAIHSALCFILQLISRQHTRSSDREPVSYTSTLQCTAQKQTDPYTNLCRLYIRGLMTLSTQRSGTFSNNLQLTRLHKASECVKGARQGASTLNIKSKQINISI